MKKLLVVLAFVSFLGLSSFAQISQGGIPFGKNPSTKSLMQVNIPTRSMPVVDVEALTAEDLVNDNNKEIPWRFGKNISVDLNIKTAGIQDILPGGDKIWRLRVFSEGALTLNFTFDNYNLPAGAKLFIYNDDMSVVRGAYTDFNNQADGYFATSLIEGSALILEYYEPANTQGTLHLSRVTHGYRNVLNFAAKGLNTSGSCQVNVACSMGAGWENEIRSVCMLVVGGSGFCTGALINNTMQDGTPYVLTANHCSTSNDYGSWIFWFNWQSATCNNPTSSPAHDQVTTSGSSLKARNAGSDFCLVQMNQTPPSSFNVFYSGWNNASTAPVKTMCIHHPDGDIKKISSAGPGTEQVYSNANCWKVNWDTPACTEPGSSGSPLYDENHLIVGQLYGGPSYCGAASTSMNDYYGCFHTSWNTGTTASTRLKDWLDPNNTGTTSLPGWDPNVPTVNIDAKPLSVEIPASSYCGAQQISPSVTIKNTGSDALTSLTVKYKIDNGSFISQPWSGNLASGSTAVVVFPQTSITVGVHNFVVLTFSPNGSTDEFPANDTLVKSFTVTSGLDLPFYEGFEQTAFAPSGWVISNPNSNFTWTRTTNAGGITGSTASAYMAFYGTNNSTSGNIDELEGPSVSLAGASSAYLTFKVAYRKNSSFTSRNDSLRVLVSTDCGATYSSVYYKGGAGLSTGAAINSAFFPTSASDWRTDSINLSSYAGTIIKFKFVGINRRANNLFIDDVAIETTGSSGYSVSGIVSYNNSANTVIPNIVVNLMDGASVVASDTTDATGAYNFTMIPDGNYTFSLSTSLPWGGATSTDALKIKRHIAGLELLTEPIRITAADLNVTGNITSTDALKLQRRLVGLDASFTCADWLFEKVSTGGLSITVNGANLVQNIYSICAGDVNGSYIPLLMQQMKTDQKINNE